MKLVRQLLLLTIVLAVLSGSMGITVLVHECLSSKKTDYLSYPELNLSHSKLCCYSSINIKSTSIESKSSIKKTACCKFSKLNLKVKPFQLNVGVKVPDQPKLVLPLFALSLNLNSTDYIVIFKFRPPPVAGPPRTSGKEIILFTHQLRIPSTC